MAKRHKKLRNGRLPDGLPEDGSVDAGLLLLPLICKLGQPLSIDDISFACGCGRACIWNIEKKAIHKLRVQLSRDPSLAAFFEEYREERAFLYGVGGGY